MKPAAHIRSCEEPPRDLLGSHMSIAGGVELAPARGRMLGCSAIQIFTKSNRQWSGPPISDEGARKFREAMAEGVVHAVFAHSTYLINMAAVDRGYVEKSVNALVDELERCELLGVPGLVLHPGAHMGVGEKEGIRAIAKNLKTALRRTKGCRAAVYLENVAGQGTALGRTFEELAEMRERVGDAERIAFCVDTCHALAGGYDIRSKSGYESVMARWDDVIGGQAIRAFHLNDSKKPFDSRRDRHEHIGLGEVGVTGFHALLHDPRFKGVPKVLETPKRDDGHEDRANLNVLRKLLGAKRPPGRRPSWKTPEKIDKAWADRLKRGM